MLSGKSVQSKKQNKRSDKNKKWNLGKLGKD